MILFFRRRRRAFDAWSRARTNGWIAMRGARWMVMTVMMNDILHVLLRGVHACRARDAHDGVT